MEVKTYSPADVHMTFGGVVVEGWESIRIVYSQPYFKIVKGIRNKNTRVRDRNSSATIEIVLSQSSDTNYILDAIAEQDRFYGTGRLEIMIKDRNGTEVFYTSEGFVEAPADRGYEADLVTRTWKIQCLSSGKFGNTSGTYIGELLSGIL